MQYKAIIVGIIIAILVVAGFAFRARIFPTTAPLAEQPAPRTPSGIETATSSSNSAQNPENSVVPGKNQPAKPLAAYRGRPLDEVKFNPDVLKMMTGERTDKLSADIRKYAKAVKETPEYTQAWLQLALLKKSIGDYEGARDIWVYVSITRPHEATAFLNLGDLYTNYLKDYPQAETNYRSAIKTEPKNALGYLGLSDLYFFFYKEKAGQAEAVLKEGIAANPNDVNLQKALARLYERNQK